MDGQSAQARRFRWRCVALIGLLGAASAGGCGGKEEGVVEADVDAGGPVDADPDAQEQDGGADAGQGADAGVDAGMDAAEPDAMVCPGSAGCPCEDDGDCDDDDACTFGESCLFEECLLGQPLGCDDGNACTDDVCDPAVGCTQTDNTALCSDLDECSEGDRCQAGGCVGKLEKVCDDGNVCTNDGCDSSQGCFFSHNDIACKDGNACLETSYCAWGYCSQGKLKPCNDGLSCTWDVCDPKEGCKLTPIAVGLACAGTVVHDRCFEAFADKTPLTWKEADAACGQWGGVLATLAAKEANVAARAVADGACNKGVAWIGLTDQVLEGWWRWTDGSAPQYANWNGGEPNNASNEDYTQMLADGRWNDVGAAAKLGCRVCSKAMSAPCAGGDKCTASGACDLGKCVPSIEPLSCDDGNPCAVDLCAPATGCSHEPVADDQPCGLGGVCAAGVCGLPNAVTLNDVSCLALLNKNKDAPSGLYWLDADGPTGALPPYRAWCDMHHDGGGWTLALKVDGTDKLLHYNAKAWGAKTAINPDAAGLDDKQALLQSYWTVPFTEVRVGMRTGKDLRWATVKHVASSLHGVLSANKPAPTTLGLAGWKSLISSASLQLACHLEGFNVAPNAGGARVRIGIIGNNENNCASPDSWLGIGGNQTQCGQKNANTAGNIACHGPNAGGRKTRSFGYVLVR